LLNKFGSLEPLFGYDGGVEHEYFSRVLMFWYPTETDLVIKTNRGWILHETKELPLPFYRVGFLLHLRKIAAYARRYDIKAIRAFDPYFAGLAGWFLKILLRTNFLISVHADYDKLFDIDGPKGAPTFLKSRRLAKKLERFLLARADRVIAITLYIKRYAEANGAGPEKIVLFRHMVPFNEFDGELNESLLDSLSIPPNKLVISAVCRLSRHKKVYDVVELASRLAVVRDDFIVVLAGGGEEEAALRQLIADRDLGRFVRLTGFLNQGQVAALRRRSTVSLALLDGRSLIEAAIAGSAVVAYEVEWHGEIVENETTGYLVPDGDVEALTKATSALLDSPSQAQEFGAALRRRVAEMYDPQTIMKERRSTYADLFG